MFKEEDENLIVKLPFGSRDIFPIEAQEREAIKEIIGNEFRFWGYGEVKTPIFEFTKNISAGVGKNWKDKLISFFDIDGNLVSLRADMTVPIARLTGMRIKVSQLPVRFFYFANSFRQSALQKGEKRILNQAGLEFIGSSSFASDIEVLVILSNILKKLEIKDFKIGIGHVKLIEGLCSWLNLDTKGIKYIKDNLVSKNIVSVEEFLIKKDRQKTNIFIELLKPENDIKNLEKIISRISEKKVTQSFEYLRKVYNVLTELDLGKYLLIDLSMVREFDYYSGLLFEVYSSRITDLLGSGGRYDGLIKKFGLDVPATGFALDVDLLHKSLEESKLDSFRAEERAILFGDENDCLRLIQFSEKLKRKKIIVELLFENEDNLEKMAVGRKCRYIFKIKSDSSNLIIFDLNRKSKEIKKIEEYK
jgi:ATP phosphoribosyltransferase regulatory subunit